MTSTSVTLNCFLFIATERGKFVLFSVESTAQDDCHRTNTIWFALQMGFRRAGHLKEFFKTQFGDRVE
jgi:hypothetical protein